MVIGVSGAQVDRVEDFLFGSAFPYPLNRGDCCVEEDAVVFIAEERGVFFSNEVEVFAEFLFEDHPDDRLGREVRDGDWGLVVLGHRADLLEIVLHFPAND